MRENNKMLSNSRGICLKYFLFPVVTAAILYSVVLTDNLFGDEFDEYGFAVLGRSRFGMSTALNIHTQFARLGYVLVGEPWAIRIYSMLCCMGAIIFVGKLADKFLPAKGAICAMWIAALSPFLVEFGADARPNAIFVFAGILFLYAIVTFTENESWPNMLLVVFSACFGLLAREMFIAVLFFGLGYYTLKRRRITLKLFLICLASLPLIARLAYRMTIYSKFAPKESLDAPASLLNVLFRIPMAFNFGFCTLKYPEREANFSISIVDTISQNIFSFFIVLIVFCGFLVVFLYYFRRNRENACFLAGSVIIPISILLIIQETGFSILNVRHCGGVIGGYYILIAAIVTGLFKSKWGKPIVLLYAYLVVISLYHFYFQPEIYSRRSNFQALNTELEDNLKNDDYVILYHRKKGSKPDYLTALQHSENTIDIYDDLPSDMSLDKYMLMISEECKGRIFLIAAGARRWVDPNNSVMPILQKERDYTLRKYGRNLSLYIFDKLY